MNKNNALLSEYSEVFISDFLNNPVKTYRKRRENLLSHLDSFCVFAGVSIEPGLDETFSSVWTRFIQDPAFLFLTGINQVGCYLLLDPLAPKKEDQEILFIPPKNANKEFWLGKRMGYEVELEDLKSLTGFENILPNGALWGKILDLSERSKTPAKAYAFFYDAIHTDHNAKFVQKLEDFLPDSMDLKNIADVHLDLRMSLDEERVTLVQKAQAISKDAFLSILKNMGSYKTERDLSLQLNLALQLQSDGDLAFPTIVAAGKNACSLHYSKKDEPLCLGDLVLLDFGIRVNTQHSDISRTIPISGVFNPLQKLLYNIVLDAQAFHEAQVKPGFSLAELDPLVWDFIIRELENRLVKKGGSYKLLYDKRPHGVSHFIGEFIHEGDPKGRSLDKKLKAGMLISNEPGLYGHFELEIQSNLYKEQIGIRIEDNLLITETGCINLSKSIPKTVSEIEAWMAPSKFTSNL
ncbi:MAG: M24 family metallopeptidase [Fibrobacter sp.]|nr:M24 family metallopeptidase [Fibrobacter sp.]